MKNKNSIIFLLFSIFVISLFFNTYSSEVVAPGSEYNIIDFSNITKGLYSDGNDLYYLLDTGVVATEYMYMQGGEVLYFGDDGKMVKNEIVEHDGEKYFFDTTGHIVKNRWVTQEDTDVSDNSKTLTVYYFGSSGRAYRAKEGQGLLLKTIDDAKYGFNEEGKRLTGYVSLEGEELDAEVDYAYENCAYYFDPGESGAAASGWIEYDGLFDTNKYEEDSEIYLYFDEKTGRKVAYRGNKEDGYIYRTIDGQRYMFDKNGVRFFKWYEASSSSPRYYSDDYDGFLAKGWFLAVPPKDSIRQKNRDRYNEDSEVWFYADSRGYVIRNCIKKIGRHTYAFDEDGVMQADAFVVLNNGKYDRTYEVEDMTRDMLVLGVDDGGVIGDNETVLYFIDPENEDLSGALAKTDTKVKIEIKDADVDFYQNSRGGYTAEKSSEPTIRANRFYQHGVLLNPIDDNKYGIVKKNDDEYCVVNKSGTIVSKVGSYKISPDEYILIDTNGHYVGIYNTQCRYINGHWEYKDDKNWITCKVDELPPSENKLDDTPYYVNIKRGDTRLTTDDDDKD